jgi:sialic acid synthase SpsE/mannose-6-phosphate isomerase-like protein (cupin superfamily)
MKTFDFTNLFILDLANNHQGDVAHGKKIISEISKVVQDAGIRAAIKFQFRDLDTFIHPAHQVDSSAAHVPRFLGTRLTAEEYLFLLQTVKEHGLLTMCTPFDEVSVSQIAQMGFDVIKVASCSVTDVPLLEEVTKAGKPVVISTGGCPIAKIDRVVHLMSRGQVDFALEHCVSIYPTPSDHLQLNQIDLLKERYPEIPIGWSTHEDPDDTITVQLACSKGATIFERHVGIANKKYGLNSYSSSPGQIAQWLSAFKSAQNRCGALHRSPATAEESRSLRSLARGVFAARDISKGQPIRRDDVFFAIPAPKNGLLVSQWREDLVATSPIVRNDPIPNALEKHIEADEQFIDQIILQLRGMLHIARIKLSGSSTIELSHHYGLRRFREFGAIIIDIINREYCKKLIVQLPRQKHPYHFHKKKEETFQVLSGSLKVEKNGAPTNLNAGDIYLVEPNAWHKFSSFQGVIFEEISTTHFNDDSFYEDPAINMTPRSKRKTIIENWTL